MVYRTSSSPQRLFKLKSIQPVVNLNRFRGRSESVGGNYGRSGQEDVLNRFNQVYIETEKAGGGDQLV